MCDSINVIYLYKCLDKQGCTENRKQELIPSEFYLLFHRPKPSLLCVYKFSDTNFVCHFSLLSGMRLDSMLLNISPGVSVQLGISDLVYISLYNVKYTIKSQSREHSLSKDIWWLARKARIVLTCSSLQGIRICLYLIWLSTHCHCILVDNKSRAVSERKTHGSVAKHYSQEIKTSILFKNTKFILLKSFLWNRNQT